MRAILAAAAAVLALGLAGCGSDKPTKKPDQPAEAAPAAGEGQPQQAQQPAPAKKDNTQWYDYGPGDPRGDIKALQKAKETVKKAEDSRKQVPGEEE